jgi:hypothetical protein
VVCSGAKGLLTRRTNSHEDMAFVPCSAAYNGHYFGWSFRGCAEVERKGEPEICNSVLSGSPGPRNDGVAVMPNPPRHPCCSAKRRSL